MMEKACESYQKAMDTSYTDLPTTHPIRLGLALNFSVFYFEIKDEQEKACEMAKKVCNCNIHITD